MKRQWKRFTSFLLAAVLLMTNTVPVLAEGSVEPPKYHLTVEQTEGGTVGISGPGVEPEGPQDYNIQAGSEVAVTASPEAGYETTAMTLNGNPVESMFVMPEGDSILSVAFSAVETASEEEVTPEVTPEQTPEATPEQTPEATPEQTPEATPEQTPEVTPEQTPEVTPEQTPEATPEQTPEVTPEQTPEVTPEQTPEVTPEQTPEATPEQTPEVTPEQTPEATPEQTPEATPEQTPEVTPEQTPEAAPQTDGDVVVNSQGIEVKRSLLCDDPNCLEEHVGKTLSPSAFPVSGMPAASLLSGEVRMLEDVYVGMVASGWNASVLFVGEPGHRGYFIININDGALAGTSGTGLCINHGAANPGEGGAVICDWEATCTAVEGNMATWDFVMTPEDACEPGSVYGYQRVGMTKQIQFEEAKGNLEIFKTSAQPEITDGNGCYSLQGAVYGLYQNGMEVAQATTDEYGYAAILDVKKGDYVLKELQPPKGYALDMTEYPVTINSGQNTRVDVMDRPQSDPVAVLLGKVDAETNQDKPQGSASLEGAEFTVKYYNVQLDTDPAVSGYVPVRTWVLRTNSNGFTYLSEDFKVAGDGFYYSTFGAPTLPLGTITIQETKAPYGYLLNPELFVRQITSDGYAESVQTYNAPVVPETPQKGVIRLKKVSSEADYGASSLKGAVYEVRDSANRTVATLTTDSKGNAQSQELPLGTYKVQETVPPQGFTLDKKAHTVELAAKNNTDRVFYADVTSTEVAQRGVIKLKKVSSNADYGASSLEGAVYEIKNSSGKIVGKLSTDAKGQATSKELPWGTYTVKEVEPPYGFLLDENTYTVHLTTDNKTEEVFSKTVTSTEVPQRGVIRLQKKSSEADYGSATLKGARYEVKNSAGKVVDTLTTDSKGAAKSAELPLGTYTVKEVASPQGFLLDKATHTVKLAAENTTSRVFYEDVTSTEIAQRGIIKLQKKSSEADYGTSSLKGAVYEVKNSAGKVVDTLTTDAKGQASSKELPWGTYTVKETKNPTGFLLDKNIYTVSLTTDNKTQEVFTKTVTSTEVPQKGIIRLQKKSSEADYGSATLKGAIYEVKNSAGKVVDTLTTDAKGQAASKELPLGTYTVKEKTSPAGFLVDKTTYTVKLTAEDSTSRVFYKDVASTEIAQRGIIKLQKKSSEADYGDSSLKGAVYEVKNSAGKVVDTLTTDSKGQATSKELPWGTYTVREVENPYGFLLDKTTYTVSLTTDNKTDRVFYKGVTSTEVPQKGIIELQKVDAETGENKPQGAGSLEGARYDIFLKSAYQAGDDEKSKSYKGTLTTDKDGKAKSKELPLETYYVIEREASEGYLLDTKVYEIKLTAENKTDRVFIKKMTSEEKIIRGNVEIIKLKEIEDEDEDTFEGLEGVEFTFTSDTTGKVVKKIVTDKNGFATTVDKDNPRGGLVFDTYTVTETKCPEGLKPIEPFKVTIKEEGVTLKGIYKEDKLIVSPVSVVKVDASTGNVIPVANTEFRLLDENKKPITMTTHYPNTVVHTTFKTDGNGQLTFPDKLKYGTYYLEELNAPYGYLKGELLKFSVTEGSTWEKPLVVKYADENAMGKIRVLKVDEETEKPLPAGAEFEIRAAEDIVTPDGTVRAKEGAVVDTIVTGDDSVAESRELFLGKYILKETKAPQGYLLNEKELPFTLEYKDQDTPVVVAEGTFGNKPAMGAVKIQKVDAETGEKIPAGAEFEIRAAKDIVTPDGTVRAKEGEVVDTVTIKENGEAASKKLYLGSYEVQETKAPEGYVLNDKIYPVELVYEDQLTPVVYQTVKAEDAPVMGQIKIVKTDKENGEVLAGAEFEIRAAKDILAPDGTVRVKKGEVVDTVTTEKDGTAISRKLYLGSYEVQETKAPDGYVLDEKIYDVKLKYKDQDTLVVLEELAAKNQPNELELLKVDAKTEKPLAGVTFKIWNKAMESDTDPEMAVASEYVTDEEGLIHVKRLVPGTYRIQEVKTLPGYVLSDEIFEITVGEDGRIDGEETGSLVIGNDLTKTDITKHDITTGKEIKGGKYQVLDKDGKVVDEWKGTGKPHRIEKLAAGETYILREILAPEGYLITKDVEFTLDNTGKVQKVELSDEPAMGMIEIRKTDAENGEPVSGAHFKVYAAEDIVTPDGTVRVKKGELVDELVTEKGSAKTKELFLGKYRVEESEAAPGYILNKDVFEVELKYKDQNTPIVVETVDITNQPNEVVLQKVDAETGKPLAGVAFKIWNKAMAGTEEEGLDVDAAMGVAFTFKTDGDGKIFLKRLQPGTYCILETSTLPGYVLNEKVYEFTISKAGKADIKENVLKIKNEKTRLLGTVAKDKDTGTQEAVPKKNTVFIDTVKFEKLQVGQEYTVKGTLMDKATGKPLLVKGKKVTAETSFKPEKADGSVDVEFVFDASGLKGKQIVVFEKVFIGEKEILAHEDLKDKKQTITFPDSKIGTSAKDKDTGTQEAITEKDVTIIDTVTYENLIVGQEYTVKGTLINKATGKPLLVDGKKVTAETSFKPEKPDGTADVTFVFDGSALKGTQTVVFEKLFVDGVEVAAHEDLEDKDQTITFPDSRIHTTARDKGTGTQEAVAKKDVTIIDTVTYENLIVGQEYTVKGTLMDKATGEPLLVDGKKVTAETSFKPEKPDGTADVTFVFDGSALKGTQTVVFEKLFVDGVEVAAHENLEDKDQTITFPDSRIHTTARDKGTGTQEAIAKRKVTIIDTVTYENLIVGQEYTVKGRLMDKATGEPLLVDGQEVTGETSFIPESADGTTEVEFKLDASELRNTQTVVFEKLFAEGVEVAAHEDLADSNQTITFKLGSLNPNLPGKKGDGQKTSVDTGDTVEIAPWLLLLFGAAGVGAVIVVIRRKKGDQNG